MLPLLPEVQHAPDQPSGLGTTGYGLRRTLVPTCLAHTRLVVAGSSGGQLSPYAVTKDPDAWR